MSRIIAYDMCRLFIGPYFATPRGIDRVDLAMANHVFADPDSPNIAILPTPLGVRAYPARVGRDLLGYLHHIWGETAETDDDLRLRRLIAGMLGAQTAPEHPGSGLSRAQRIARAIGTLRHTGLRLGQAAETRVPRGAVYVNFGQLALAMPGFFKWLDRRPDVACALMIHDTIPLDHPELVTPASVAHHAQMVATAARHADALLFSTAFVRSSVETALRRVTPTPIPGLVRALPVPTPFATAVGSVPELAGTQYFMVVSTVEPRKNFGVLIAVWQRLVDRMGSQAPHLVIVGASGREAARILAPLAASPALRGRVHHVSGLPTPTLVRLMSGCAALLSPSFVEGFGLPLLEGIAMGVPTIASDIPSHREIAHGGSTVLLDPGDHAGWEAAILATPRAVPATRHPVPRAMTEAAYCSDVLAFLDGIEAKRPRTVAESGAESGV